MSTPRRSGKGTRSASRAVVARDVPGVAGDTAPDGSSALGAVHDTYRLLDDHFDEIYAACRTDADRARLRALHASARDAYWKAIADGLHDDNLVVQDIRRDLATANARIQEQLATLEEVADLLRAMTEAVRLAGALVGLAAAS